MTIPSQRTITLGSRPSKLALWQTRHVMEQLQTAYPRFSYRMLTLLTEGDKIQDRPLPEIGGKGLFTAELETALHANEIDLAVHSLKDLPVETAPGLCIGSYTRRACAQDVLISPGRTFLAMLDLGASVGTSSLRREAQLRAHRPDLTILPLRGNVDSRIRKALDEEYDAIILAAAGVERLGLSEYISEYLPFEVMLPAPGQGVLAVQCRADDFELLQCLQSIHDPASFRAASAERAFLAALGGGCSAPIAAYAQDIKGRLQIRGLVASPDGRKVIRVNAVGQDPLIVGAALAQSALDQGARELLP